MIYVIIAIVLSYLFGYMNKAKKVDIKKKKKQKNVWYRIADNLHGFLKHVIRCEQLNEINEQPHCILRIKDIYHWAVNEPLPPIIGSREILYYLLHFNYTSIIYIDGYFYSIEPTSNLLCISNQFIQMYRDKKGFITSRSKKDISKDFELIYGEKLNSWYYLPEKLSMKSETSLASLIRANIFEKGVEYDGCFNTMQDLLSHWYPIDKSFSINIFKTNKDLFKDAIIKREMIYRLTKDEIDGCEKIVKAMTFFNKLSNAKGDMSMKSKKSQWDKSLQGVVSELGVCRMLGVPVQIHHTYSRTAATDTFDGTLPDGRTFDVKSITKSTYPIKVTANKIKNPADIYILAYVYDQKDLDNEFVSTYKDINVEIKGFIEGSIVFLKENMKSGQYTIPQSEMKELKDIIK